MLRLRRLPHRQRGRTIFELMVGVTLGLLLAVALLVLYSNTSTSDQHLQRASAQIENGRYAAELLREDLRLAGFFGETLTASAAYTTPDPCATTPSGFVASPFGLPTAVRGYRAGEALGCLANRRAGTDALVVRRLETATVPAASIPAGNTQFYVQYTYCPTDPALVRVIFSKDKDDFTLRNRSCTAANPVRAYVSRIYFVASCNRCGGGGDGIPTLKRLDLVGNQLVETPLVEGIETLRFEYGFDTDNDGSPNAFLTSPASGGAASRWENVVSMKLHFVVRGIEPTPGEGLTAAQDFDFGGAGTVSAAADRFVRRGYSATIRLINPSSVREMQ